MGIIIFSKADQMFV